MLFLTDFPQKLIISLEPICVIVTKKLLRYLQNSRRYRADKFLMIHRQIHTHTQTQRLPKYMADFILPCNKTVILGQSIDKSVIWGRGRQELRDGASGEENWEAGQTSSHRGSRCRSAKNLKRNRNDRQTWQDCVKCTRQITRFRL